MLTKCKPCPGSQGGNEDISWQLLDSRCSFPEEDTQTHLYSPATAIHGPCVPRAGADRVLKEGTKTSVGNYSTQGARSLRKTRRPICTPRQQPSTGHAYQVQPLTVIAKRER